MHPPRDESLENVREQTSIARLLFAERPMPDLAAMVIITMMTTMVMVVVTIPEVCK